MNDFEKKVAVEYNSRFIKYGAQPKSSLWFSRERQNVRFDTIIYFMKKSSVPHFFSINDIGCGYGGFLSRLNANFGQNQFCYTGFDLARSPIEYCETAYKQKGVKFFCGSKPIEKADYSVMSGTFNYAPNLTVKSWKEYLFANLKSAWKMTKQSMIFNLMIAEEATITQQCISFIEKEAVIKHCQKNFGDTHYHFSSKLPQELTFCVDRRRKSS